MFKFLFEHLFSILSGIYLEVGVVDDMLTQELPDAKGTYCMIPFFTACPG